MRSIPFASCGAALFLAVAAGPVSAQIAQPGLYEIGDASYAQGCVPPCLCPTQLVDDVVGTFSLHYTHTDASGYDHYAVTNVDWYVGAVNPDHVTGSGEYLRGGPGPVQVQLVLDLSINGSSPSQFDSNLVTPQSPLPHIDISIVLSFTICNFQGFDLCASPAGPGTPYCAGDGAQTACPCGNSGLNGHGCANSADPSGALLTAIGLAGLSFDTTVLISSGTPDSSLLFFQGTARVNGGAGVVFGDGLRCAGGSIVRLGSKTAVGGQAVLPGPGDPSLSQLGGVAALGTYDYQVWYRNAASFCTSATYNLSNAYEITWNP